MPSINAGCATRAGCTTSSSTIPNRLTAPTVKSSAMGERLNLDLAGGDAADCGEAQGVEGQWCDHRRDWDRARHDRGIVSVQQTRARRSGRGVGGLRAAHRRRRQIPAQCRPQSEHEWREADGRCGRGDGQPDSGHCRGDQVGQDQDAASFTARTCRNTESPRTRSRSWICWWSSIPCRTR